ncbi:5-formyltetrahydrofolate cyclo-ligase [Pelagivirga sediminicola]|uniref:5-formyltetrahydrofolate cyclo-ligase n=1 Tax=Pelagivirga sediminicola TaxID=2170575 RepID=A0A2T7G741_9RHOB|nr:5-formyltetrahydrofolate cyclo-ligase [Pelagivirga sediminicola]PVA10255.1 5-formyltetrahydrofolate cyclo-ligase [Pelagivirga sediminicola]
MENTPGSAAWRKEKRQALIENRQAIPVAARLAADAQLAERLDEMVQDVSGKTISLYWPFRGEPDLRKWAAACQERGARLALPVVVAKATPLEFRRWQPGDKLEKGVWNIPVPPEGAEVVLPDIVLSPVVGLDAQNYRLGYGGGFFDRTLAALRDKGVKARAIGVGYAHQRMDTIHPHEFDIPMDDAILIET